MKHLSLAPLKTLHAAMMLFIALTQSSQAYIGPGAGIGAIGTAIALLGALILLVVGFVWYPTKRLLRRRKNVKSENDEDRTQNEEDKK